MNSWIIGDYRDPVNRGYSSLSHVGYGGEWMWIAHRTPWLRDALARIVLAMVLTIMCFAVWRGMRFARGERSDTAQPTSQVRNKMKRAQ